MGIDTKCESRAEVSVTKEFSLNRHLMVGKGQWIADGSDNRWLLVGQLESRWFDYQPPVRPDQHQIPSQVTVGHPESVQYGSQHIPQAQLESYHRLLLILVSLPSLRKFCHAGNIPEFEPL